MTRLLRHKRSGDEHHILDDDCRIRFGVLASPSFTNLARTQHTIDCGNLYGNVDDDSDDHV